MVSISSLLNPAADGRQSAARHSPHRWDAQREAPSSDSDRHRTSPVGSCEASQEGRDDAYQTAQQAPSLTSQSEWMASSPASYTQSLSDSAELDEESSGTVPEDSDDPDLTGKASSPKPKYFLTRQLPPIAGLAAGRGSHYEYPPTQQAAGPQRYYRRSNTSDSLESDYEYTGTLSAARFSPYADPYRNVQQGGPQSTGDLRVQRHLANLGTLSRSQSSIDGKSPPYVQRWMSEDTGYPSSPSMSSSSTFSHHASESDMSRPSSSRVDLAMPAASSWPGQTQSTSLWRMRDKSSFQAGEETVYYHSSDSVRTAVAEQPAPNKEAWKKHATSLQGPDDVTVFKCLFAEGGKPCGYTAKRHLVKRHIETRHLKIKDHQCPYCEKAFPQRVSLSIHINRHTGNKPHRCRYDCDKTFSDPARRHKHMVEVHGYNPQGPRKRHRNPGNYQTNSAFETIAPWTSKVEEGD